MGTAKYFVRQYATVLIECHGKDNSRKFMTAMRVLRAGVKDGKDRDDDDQVDVWCFPERKQLRNERRRRLVVEATGDVMRRGRLR